MAHLYKRGQTYWIKYYQGSRCFRESLKTQDRVVAKYLKNEKENILARGTNVLPLKDVSAFKVLEEYLKSSQFRKTPKTFQEDERRIKYFLQWASIFKINQIESKTVDDYFNYRLKTDSVSFATINRTIDTFKTYFKFAVNNGYLAKNPIEHLKKFKLVKNPPRFYNEEEIQRLFAAAKGYKLDFYLMVVTAIYTGMRIGELLHLEWPDFDWQKNLVRVINKDNFTTKNKKFRIIPLNDKLIKILKPHRQKEGYCFFLNGSRKHPPKKGFYAVLKRAGLKKTGFHILRHTFASRLVQTGVSIYKVSKWLGHSSVDVTMSYSHLAPEKDEDINKI